MIADMGTYDELEQAVKKIRLLFAQSRPKIGLILGSGLGDFASVLEHASSVPYAEVPHFPTSSVEGHAGRLVVGNIGDEPIIALQGRVHAYEGYTPQQVIFPTRVLCLLGVRALVVTNAAGGINPDLLAGDLMAITDHLNLAGWNALTGPNEERLGPRFPDMSKAYDPRLLALIEAAAKNKGIALKRGIYAMASGPSYETPAEVRALRTLGADAVGMSTVPEVTAAVHMGVRVAGISCITNLAAGIGDKPLSHREVAETAQRARGVFQALLCEFLPAAARIE